MVIAYLKKNEIDKSLWDECINSTLNPQIYGLSWYLDIVSPGWEAIVAITAKSYQVCFPIPVKQKFSFKFVSQPYLCQQLGIYFHSEADKEAIQKILDQIFDLYKYIPKITFNINNNFLSFNQKNLKKETLYTHLLKLDRPYADIYKNYRRDRKYRLKQAQKRNPEIIMSEDIEPQIQIFKDDTEHKVPGFNANSHYPLLRNLFNAVKKNTSFELYYVREKDHTYSSSCWFVFYKNQIIYLGNASTRNSRNKNGRTYIIDHLIQKYQNSDKVLDFESPRKESIRSFYASFGSNATPFSQIYYNNLPTVIRRAHTAKIKLQRGLISIINPKGTLPEIHYPNDF